MKKILKKTKRFVKRHPHIFSGFTVFLLLLGCFIVLPKWLATWIFYFALWGGFGIYCAYCGINFTYLIYTKGMEAAFKKYMPKTEALWARITLCSLTFIMGSGVIWMFTIPILKHTIISLFHHDT